VCSSDLVPGIAPSQPFHPWYIPLILFVFVFTIGEGIWSPRVMEYTASIAPKHRVGSYMSLSVLPWFASKPLVAAIMAWILPSFSPAEGTIHPTSFWLVIAISALSTPVLIFFFQKMIRSTTENNLDEDADEKDNLPDSVQEVKEKKDMEPPPEEEKKGEGSAG
jgi:MFS family permease